MTAPQLPMLGSLPVENVVPHEPWRRRCVIFLTSQELRRVEHANPELTLNPEVFFYRIGQSESQSSLIRLMGSPAFKPGTFLIQSPYMTSMYSEIAEARQRFALARHYDFCTFVQLLGARVVEVKQLEVKLRERSFRAELGGGYKVVSAEFKGHQEQFQRLEQSFSLRTEFRGGPADVSRAESFLRERNLLGDLQMDAMLQGAKLSKNELKSMEVNVSLTEESAQNFKFAASLSIPIARVAAEVSTATKDLYEYNLTMSVRFSE